MSKLKQLPIDRDELAEEVAWGYGQGAGGLAALSAPASLAGFLAAGNTIAREDMPMVRKMIKDVDKVNPGVIIKQLLPLESDNVVLRLLDKFMNRYNASYSLPRSIVFPPSPEKYWGKMKALGKIREKLKVTERPRIVFGAGADTLMHELGHAEHLAGTGPRRHRISNIMAPSLGLAGAIAATKAGQEDFAPLIGAAGFIPMLYDEAQATTRALRNIYKAQGAKRALKGLARLGPSFLTYASLPVGAYFGIKKAIKEYKETEREKALKYKELFEKNSHINMGFVNKLRELLIKDQNE